MQSRQIQVFGLIGSAVLVLFIVIFLGADIHRQLQNFSSTTISLRPMDDEQVVMEASAVKDLTERINSESREMLQSMKAQKDQADQEEKSARQTVTEHKTEPATPLTQHPSQVADISDTAQKKAAVPAKVQKQIVSDTGADLQSMNSTIRSLLRSVPFFQHSMGLTPENKRVLDAVAAKVASIDYPYKLVIEGHTEAGIAPGVSEKMAFRVASYLQRKLPAVVIDTVGYADAYPIIDDPSNKENRRVEIIVRRSEG